MKKNKTYCSYCGREIIKKEIDDKLRDCCSYCDTVFYENPLPVASSIVVNDKREVLLVKRNNEPYKGMWCLPIGFAESGERIEVAALRELEEEAGIKGEIIRLIDVDTVDNYYYGSLAIVTYEVRHVEGEITPGDDASEAGYFPIFNIPELAWSSNEKAIQLYIDNYRDVWKMIDSFRMLFPEVESDNEFMSESADDRNFLSTLLIKLIDTNMSDLVESWVREVRNELPDLIPLLSYLTDVHRNSLRGIQYWLTRRKDTLGVEEFIQTGKELKKRGISLPDVLTAMALSRKSLWMQLVKEKILLTPINIYTTLEINNLIIFFYDKINYNITKGYYQ